MRVSVETTSGLERRRIFDILACVHFARFNVGLPGWPQVFRDHRLLEGLADHLTQHFLAHACAESLLHDLHGYLAGTEAGKPDITSGILQSLFDRRVDSVRGDADRQSPLEP